MPGALVHVGASATCPHGGQVQIAPGNPRVKVGGQPVATTADTFAIVGCAFTLPGGKPQPCVKVQWTQPAARVKAGQQPVVLQASVGLCLSAEQIPQGPPNITATQLRVRGQ